MLKNTLRITIILLATFSLISSCNDEPKAKGSSGKDANSRPTSPETVQQEPNDITTQQLQAETAVGNRSGALQDANKPKKENADATEPNVPNKGQRQDTKDSNSNEPNKSKVVISKQSGPNEPNAINARIKQKDAFNSKFSSIFSEFVDNQGTVDYKRLKLKRNDLRKDLDDISRLDLKEYKSWPKEEQIALWINAYNLKMLNIIVDNYPIESNRILQLVWGPDSIRHIDRSIGGIEKQKIIVMGEEFILSSIEEEIFYKRFVEPRCFFAISHLGFSGPPLLNEAYVGSRLNEQIDEQIKKYLSDPRSFKIDTESKTVYLPPILEKNWYGKYFTEKYKTNKKFKDRDEPTAAVLNFLINYLPATDVSFLELQNYTVTYVGYNWRLKD